MNQLETISKATVETGRIFQSGGIDGLVLFALILGTGLMFLVAVYALWSWQSAVVKQAKECRLQGEAFATTQKDQITAQSQAEEKTAEAAKDTAEALRDVATALAASSSADMTFKQAQANLLDRAERLLSKLEESMT